MDGNPAPEASTSPPRAAELAAGGGDGDCGASGSEGLHIGWASRIKEQHYHLQQRVVVAAAAGVDEDDGTGGRDGEGEGEADLRRWRAALSDPAEQPRLRAYAAAMHDLATKYWEAPAPDGAPDDADEAVAGRGRGVKRSREEDGGEEGGAVADEALMRRRYNDRVACSLDCVRAFFLGAPRAPSSPRDGDADAPLYDTYPLIVSRALKPLRRDFYATHGRMATAAELDGMVLAMLERSREGGSGAGSGSSWDHAMRYVGAVLAARTSPSPSPRPPAEALHALDVGSCYGPFFGKSLPVPVLGDVPLRVTAMDLCPYNRAGASEAVLQGDWLSVRLLPDQQAAEAAAAASATRTVAHDGRVLVEAPSAAAAAAAGEPPGPARVVGVVAGRYDVVLFCLLLSYLPTPRLRYRACLHAALALRAGGLLVVVSTRTQGSRRDNWEQAWARTMASVGLAVVHKQVRKKIVVHSFEKQPRAAAGEEDGWASEAEIEEWIAERLRQPEAETGLRIVADGHM